MSGQHLAQSEDALQHVVVLSRDLLYQRDEAGFTRTCCDVFRFCHLENIDYLVLRYQNTGKLPFEEWAEEWLYDAHVHSSCMKDTVYGGDLISHGLAVWCKR
jgi:hypothetical protein